MDEDTAEVVRVLLDPVVEALDLLLLEEPQHPLLQLAAPLAGDDLHGGRLLGDGLVDHGPQGGVDLIASVVYLVQVELELHTRSGGDAARHAFHGAHVFAVEVADYDICPFRSECR